MRLPTRLFLGSSVRTSGVDPLAAAVGLEAEGLLRPGLRLRVEAHRAPAGVSTFVADQRMQSAWIRLRPATLSIHGFGLDAGWMSLENLSAGTRTTGPAGDARYSYHDGTSFLDVNLRHRPALAGMRATSPNELRISGLTEAPRDFGLTGEYYIVDQPGIAGDVARVRGGEAGVFVHRGVNRFELRGRLRVAEGSARVEERSIEAAAELAAGPGTIDGRLEIGEARGDGPGEMILRTAAGFNLRGQRGWGRVGLAYQRDAWTGGEVSVDVSGAYRLSDAVELYGSLSTSTAAGRLLDPGDIALVQAGAQIDVRADLTLLLGIERTRTPLRGGGALRFSVGIRKGLPLPIPFPRRRAVQGVVYEDLDGNERRAPDEPYIDGVRLTMGAATANSERGHFAFPIEAPPAPVRVDLASLGPGFLPPPVIAEPDTGRLAIPLHRAASLRIETFLDANRNGRRDPAEAPLADVGIEVSRPGSGAWRLNTADDGGAQFDAVRPGDYVARVDPATLPRRADAPGVASISVMAGEAGTLRIAVPPRPIAFLSEVPGAAEAGGAPEAGTASETRDASDAEDGRK